MSNIRYLFFDLGGVIILKKDVDWESFDSRYSLKPGKAREIFQSLYHKQTKGDDFDLQYFFQKNYSDQFSWLDFKKIRKKVFKKETINEPLLDWIEKQKRNYTIALLTNNTVALGSLLESKFEIKHLFDYIFNSAEIGYAKPDRRFFGYVLENIDARAEECLFIDNKEENVEAACEFGFQPVLFKSNEDFFSKELFSSVNCEL